MTDITLGITLTADGSGLRGEVKLSRAELDKLGESVRGAGRNAQAGAAGVDRFGREADQASRQARRLSDQSGRLARSMSTLRNAIVAVGVVRLGQDVFETAVQYQLLDNRLRRFTGTAEAFAETKQYLADTADRLGQRVSTLTDSYARFLPMVQSGIMSTREARDIMEGLSDTAVALGADSTQLGQVMYGLSQGLSAGVLRAEELNQVMEPLPGLMQEMDRAAGLPAGGFRKLVNEGQVTSEMFKKTLIQAMASFEGSAAGMANGAAGSAAKLQNAWDEVKLSFAESGFLDGVSDGMKSLADIMKDPAFQQGMKDFGAFVGGALKWIAANPDLVAGMIGAFAGTRIGAGLGGIGGARGTAIGGVAGGAIGGLAGYFGIDKPELVQQQLDETNARIKSLNEDLKEAQALLAVAGSPDSGFYANAQAQVNNVSEQLLLLEGERAALQKRIADTTKGTTGAGGGGGKGTGGGGGLGLPGPGAGLIADLEREAAQLRALRDAYGGLGSTVEDVNDAITVDKALRKEKIDIQTEEGRAIAALVVGNEEYKRQVELLEKAEKDRVTRIEEVRDAFLSLPQGTDKAIAALASWRANALAALDATKQGYQEFAQEVEAVYRDRLDAILDENLAASKKWEDGLVRGFRNIEDEASDMATMVEGALGNAASAVEDAFVEMYRSGSLNFQKLADSIIEDLIRMQVRSSITGPLSGFLGDFFQDMFSSPGYVAGGNPIGTPVATIHTGGIAGTGEGSGTRWVDPAIFNGAPRYHGGGMAGEVPAVLKRGEGIFTPGQMAALGAGLGAGGGSVTVNVIDQRGANAADVQTRSRRGPDGRQMIDVLIADTVTKGLASGAYDSVLGTNFGVTRRGYGR